MEHVWHYHCRDKERQNQAMPGAVLQREVQPGKHFRILVEPSIQAIRAVEHAEQADQCDADKCHHLDQ